MRLIILLFIENYFLRPESIHALIAIQGSFTFISSYRITTPLVESSDPITENDILNEQFYLDQYHPTIWRHAEVGDRHAEISDFSLTHPQVIKWVFNKQQMMRLLRIAFV